MTNSLRVVKGHGTENDFIVIEDLGAELSLTPALVRALCDRHAGIGGDGVLRVVRTACAAEPEIRALAAQAEFFMDYRNADGGVAEMCGNGVRVFAKYLQRAGLMGETTSVATRGGVKPVQSVVGGFDHFRVDMGPSASRPERPSVTVAGYGEVKVLAALDMPNPHVVVEIDSEAALQDLDLSMSPSVVPPLPEGQNVEFIVRTGPRRLRMRVHERGVGETRSCGTGICAAVVAAAGAAAATGATDPDGPGEWQVDVPGGSCTVGWTDSGSVTLTGPAVLVADIVIDEAWISSVAAHR